MKGLLVLVHKESRRTISHSFHKFLQIALLSFFYCPFEIIVTSFIVNITVCSDMMLSVSERRSVVFLIGVLLPYYVSIILRENKRWGIGNSL